MKKTCTILYLALLVSCGALAGNAPANASIYAIVIGVSKYADASIHNLKYADKDARVFADSLRTAKLGAVPDKNMLVLINEDATRFTIQKEMTRLLTRVGKDDLVIFFFSGHGIQGKLEGSGYLLTYDTKKGDEEATAISMDDIKLKMQRCDAKMKISYVDACHAGLLGAGSTGKGSFADNVEIQKAYMQRLAEARRGNAIFMSSVSRQESQEAAIMEHGVFTYFLIKGLMGDADLYKKGSPGYNDGIVDISELQNYLFENIQEATGYAQKPIFNDDFDEHFPLSILRTGTTTLTGAVSSHKNKIENTEVIAPVTYKLPPVEKLSGGMTLTGSYCYGIMAFLNTCKTPITLYYASGVALGASGNQETNIRIAAGSIGTSPRLYVWGSTTGRAPQNVGECEGVVYDYSFYFKMIDNGVEKYAVLKVPVEAGKKVYMQVNEDVLQFSTTKPY